MARNTVTLACQQVSVCMPDYWQGSSTAHIAVPVAYNTTMRDLREALCRELRQGAVTGSDKTAYLLSADLVRPEEEKAADDYTRAAYAAVRRMHLGRKGGGRIYSNLEPVKDDDCEGDMVYAYFLFTEVSVH